MAVPHSSLGPAPGRARGLDKPSATRRPDARVLHTGLNSDTMALSGRKGGAHLPIFVGREFSFKYSTELLCRNVDTNKSTCSVRAKFEEAGKTDNLSTCPNSSHVFSCACERATNRPRGSMNSWQGETHVWGFFVKRILHCTSVRGRICTRHPFQKGFEREGMNEELDKWVWLKIVKELELRRL